MTERYSIELEPEVETLLDKLSLHDFRTVEFRTVERLADLLAEQPTTLGEPYSRHLGGPVRELRCNIGTSQTRITYWLAPLRRIVLLTTFVKTRSHEATQVARALAAQQTCAAEHGPAEHLYDRIFKEDA